MSAWKSALMSPQRWRALLACAWFGLLLCVALIATPAAFATLPKVDAGRVAAFVLAREAYASLALGMILVVLERHLARHAERQFSAGLMLALGTVFCTVAGYFVLQPLMVEARAGQGALSFGQLHAISLVFFGIKGLLVVALAWRATRPAAGA
jgi:hypothetical protein